MEDNIVRKEPKRLALTIISILLLIASLIFFFIIIGVDKNALADNVPKDNAAAGIAGAFGAALVLVIMIIFAIGIVIASLVGLLLSFLQRKNRNKPIRIISYVTLCAFLLIIILTIIRFITWIV